MYAIEKEILACAHCQAEVQAVDEFCPHCGTLFEAERVCMNHHGVAAHGVCIVCGEAFCRQCGGWREGRFRCEQHAH